MKITHILLLPVLMTASASCTHNVTLSRAYEELPLGAVKPAGWLKEMLITQRDGITANLDETYPQVLGDDNGWLGGEGDRWERGPYWVDGLLPLAYILDDDTLKAKAQRWVEWTLASQQDNGFFGPDKGYPYVEGLQRGLPHDWWPRIVMLKVMQQYYNATADERVVAFFDRYLRYQLETLPDTPLDKWTYWARYRAGDNLDVVLWFYNLTGKKYLLELADLIHSQSYDFTGEFIKGEMLSTPGTIHCVNLAQGLKEPVVYWQYRQDAKYLDAVHKGLADLRRCNGFANGMFGGDEALHGGNPSQGSELCSAVELMYSYEQMLKISGNPEYADELERVAFNALPAQTSADFTMHQYYQQPNQVSASLGLHGFDVGQKGTGLVFGFLTAYPCCLTNHHQGWPKFTQNLWLRSSDGGLAAMVYAPCTASAEIAGSTVRIEEDTVYPFDGSVRIRINCSSPVKIPISLRIPAWSVDTEVRVNGEAVTACNRVITLNRTWNDGDEILMHFGMQVTSSRWYANSIAIERGPLVYALGIKENWHKVQFSGEMQKEFGDDCSEVLPASEWNFALLKRQAVLNPASIKVCIDTTKLPSTRPWSLDSAPIHLYADACTIPEWTIHNGDTGPIPFSPAEGYDVNDWSNHGESGTRTIELVPYGCTKLRISQFPVLTH